MRATLVSTKPIYYFSAQQLSLLKRDQLLIVNMAERIVTLQRVSHQLQGQGRLTDATLRMLIVLLLAQEEPVPYGTLCAALSCPSDYIEALLEAGSLEVRAFQHEVTRWQTRIAVPDKAAKLVHIWRVRQAIIQSWGLNPLLKRYGFGWRARNRFNKGYVLIEENREDEDDGD